MSTERVAPAGKKGPPVRIIDRATAVARVYTRAFLSQGVGIVGLAWCLAANLPWAALGLSILVLLDQAIFLRGRQRLHGMDELQRGLDLWCLAVSVADLLLLVASLFRACGLREIGGATVTDPLSCFAFAIATLAHVDLGLAPVTAGGRLLAAGIALLGDGLLIGAVVVILRVAGRRLPGVTPP